MRMCWMLIKHKRTDKQIFHKPLLSRTSAGELIWMLKLAFLSPLVTHLSVLPSSVWYDVLHCLYFSDHQSSYLEETKSYLLVIYKSFSYGMCPKGPLRPSCSFHQQPVYFNGQRLRKKKAKTKTYNSGSINIFLI